MSMFCFQCQETLRNEGCTQHGMCGKSSDCANLMDVLIYSLRGLALATQIAEIPVASTLASHAELVLFTTLTNTNFDELRIERLIRQTLRLRDGIIYEHSAKFTERNDDILFFNAATRNEFLAKSPFVSVQRVTDPDIRAMRELLLYALKGISAYTYHARRLGFTNPNISTFVFHALAETAPTQGYAPSTLFFLLKECGKIALSAMKLLNDANTQRFGQPEPTEVRNYVRKRPGILISGHDLRDLEDLLRQTQEAGIDIYTHGEMLPAHAYPGLKKYPHLYANYGNSWHRQSQEFERFNGPIILTSNCLIPIRAPYKNRIFTTGPCGWPGLRHIPDPNSTTIQKDFQEIIRLARQFPAPTSLSETQDGDFEPKTLTVGYAEKELLTLIPDIISGLKSGEIGQIIVMIGCDGRHQARSYYRELADQLPKDTIILTAGCAKYRFNKLPLGKIENVPRLLDAGQCNDAWSIITFLHALADAMNVESLTELPITLEAAWYEQKAIAVLLALLSLKIKNIHLGPTLPAFCSRNVIHYLIENYNLQKMGNVEERLDEMHTPLQGKEELV